MLELNIQLTKPVIDCQLNLDSNGFYLLFGLSGSGKTTLLDSISGIIKSPKLSLISIDGEPLQHLAVHQRQIAYVRQHRELFPHLNVLENLEFSEYLAKKPKQVPSTSQSLLKTQWLSMSTIIEQCGIGSLLSSRVQTLSGGEKQRVSLAQMLVQKPRLLLLDEPFTALDRQAKLQLMTWLKALNQQWGIPIIYVTHDYYELEFLNVPVLSMENGTVSVQ